MMMRKKQKVKKKIMLHFLIVMFAIHYFMRAMSNLEKHNKSK